MAFTLQTSWQNSHNFKGDIFERIFFFILYMLIPIPQIFAFYGPTDNKP